MVSAPWAKMLAKVLTDCKERWILSNTSPNSERLIVIVPLELAEDVVASTGPKDALPDASCIAPRRCLALLSPTNSGFLLERMTGCKLEDLSSATRSLGSGPAAAASSKAWIFLQQHRSKPVQAAHKLATHTLECRCCPSELMPYFQPLPKGALSRTRRTTPCSHPRSQIHSPNLERLSGSTGAPEPWRSSNDDVKKKPPYEGHASARGAWCCICKT